MLFCPRINCKHNHGGRCGFFSGPTFYFSECLDDGFMCVPRDETSEENQ